VLKAPELGETLAEAHAALANVKFKYDWMWEEAEHAFDQALALNPNNAWAHNQYGQFLVAIGRFAECLAEMKCAQELDPLSLYINVGVPWALGFARQYYQAIAQLRIINTLHPDFALAYLNLGGAYAQKGMYEEAITALRKARSLDDRWVILAVLGHIYAKAGRRGEAQKVLPELRERAKREPGSEWGLAAVYSGLGEKDQALAELERAYQMRDGALTLLKVELPFDSLRSDPRFTDLLRRMNLAP
jgi:tetratricopeptide (TPR) repeat protein